jgi:hypothetical protein
LGLSRPGVDGDLPGDVVVRGIAALERGERTVDALLVSIGAPRLRLMGSRSRRRSPTRKTRSGVCWAPTARRTSTAPSTR